jgi:hypothetical protein
VQIEEIALALTWGMAATGIAMLVVGKWYWRYNRSIGTAYIAMGLSFGAVTLGLADLISPQQMFAFCGSVCLASSAAYLRWDKQMSAVCFGYGALLIGASLVPLTEALSFFWSLL